MFPSVVKTFNSRPLGSLTNPIVLSFDVAIFVIRFKIVKLMLDIMWDLIVSAVIVVRLHDVIVALTLGRVRLGFALAVCLEVINASWLSSSP